MTNDKFSLFNYFWGHGDGLLRENEYFCPRIKMNGARKSLSILIPCYNTVCVDLVRSLCQQAEKEALSAYEILVADDCSPKNDCCLKNEEINHWPHCRFIRKAFNSGSAATRNFLAEQSQYDWLLFLDCDIHITEESFLRQYLDDKDADVVNGGIAIANAPQLNSNLRYRYENRQAPLHTAELRQQQPHKQFRSTNFLINRETFLRCPFDERFQRSGYEDVLFGKQLRQKNVQICHIDNPVMMTEFEDNQTYLQKTEQNLRTLHQFRSELRGYSRLLTLVEGIHIPLILTVIRLWHRLFGSLLRRQLCSQHPSLFLFNIYRLGYYLCLPQ